MMSAAQAVAQTNAAHAQATRAAQAVTPGHPGVLAGYRMAAPTGPVAQPGTPVGWAPAAGSTPSMPSGGQPMYSPVVFHFGRPAPHILTPGPPLPCGSPALRQGSHGRTPGPKHSPPEGNIAGGGGGQDRDAAMNDYTQHIMEHWRQS